MLFEGRINQTLVGGLYSAGIVGFFAFYLVMMPETRIAGFLVIGAFAIIMFYSIFSTLSDIWNVHAVKVLARSASLFIMGQIFIELINFVLIPSEELLSFEQLVLLKGIAYWGFTAASALSLLGIFKNSRNSYLASIGSINSNSLFVLGISLIGSLYVSFVRGRLTQVSPVMVQLSPYIEWMGIVLITGIIFTVMRRGVSRSMMAPALVGSWTKHVQDTNPTKGEKLSELNSIINNFVENGNREWLLVRLFNYLDENRVSEDEMQLVLSELINYMDESPPAFSFRGRSEAIQRSNQMNRMEILARTVRRVNSLHLVDSKGFSNLGQEAKAELLVKEEYL
jgi:hypothetical protein